jgi:hypothetical protein
MSQATLPPSVLINALLTPPVNGEGLTNIVQLHAENPNDTPYAEGVAVLETPDRRASLERSAARFVVVSENDNAPRAADVERILREKSMIVTTEGAPLSRVSDEPDAVTNYVDGNIHLPRLEALHRLLCGEKGPGNARAIEVSSAIIPLVSVVLASMGTEVTFTHEDRPVINTHRRLSSMSVPEYLRRRIGYQYGHMRSASSLDVDIAYYSDPSFRTYREAFRGLNTLDIMGSEVRPGSYLVIQSILPKFHDIQFDNVRWEQICSFLMARESDLDGLVLPTVFSSLDSALNIYRRVG